MNDRTSAKRSGARPTRRGEGGRRAAGATLRISVLTNVPAVLTGLRHSPEAVLAQVGFHPDYFQDPDRPIPYSTAGRLLAHCATSTDCEHLGLLVGERGDPSLLGLVGFLTLSAPTVGTALEKFLRYLHLHDRGGVAWLQHDGDTSRLGFTLFDPLQPGMDEVYDTAIAVGCNIMRGLCGAQWNPIEVHLTRRRPRSAAAWARFYRAPVRFEAERSAIVFASSWLAKPAPAANPQLHRLLEREAASIADDTGGGFASAVRRTLSAAIAGTRCTSIHVATLMGIHVRSLNRRLQAEGTTFKDLHDEVRYGVARQLLRTTSMTLSEIASTLGYAEASAFLRAFRRWSGRTPQQWRSANSRGRPAKHARAA
jgi:AraC-like DNA-binding protein